MKILQNKWLILLLFFCLLQKSNGQCLSGYATYTYNCLNSTAIASVTVINGTGPFNYTWVPSGINTATAANLNTGFYTIYFSSGNCSGYTQLSISNPYSPSNIVITSTNVSCNGASTGAANASFVGSSGPPFTYTWSPVSSNANSSSVSGLTAGIYSVTIQDNKTCGSTNTVLITEPTQINTVTSDTFVPCYGGTISAVVSTTGGASPYTYIYNGVTASGNTLPLSAGVKTIITKDNLSCTRTNTVLVTEAAKTNIVFNTVAQSCRYKPDGSVNSVVYGNYSTYTYTWLPGGINTPNLNNVNGGTYTLSVKDPTACVTSSVVTIASPVPFNFNAITHSENCSAADGAYTLSISGGQAPYTQTIQPISGNLTETHASSGNYTVFITDALNCIDTAQFTIGNLSNVNLAVTSATPVLCYNNCNGAVQLQASNAIAPVTYSAAGLPSTTSNIITGLCAGFQSFNVIDAAGCPATATLNFATPMAFSFSATAPSVECFGKEVTLQGTASGGSGGYNYQWSPGNLSGASVSTIPNGTTVYSLNVYDSNHCTLPAYEVTVSVRPKIDISINSSATGICPGSTAQITPTVTGGDGNYTYLWLPGRSSQASVFVENITVPEYSLMVSDGCGSPTATKLVHINLFPVTVPLITSQGTLGCAPFCAEFTNITPKSKNPVWEYGEASVPNTENSMRYCYQSAGIYNIKLSLVDSNSCKTAYTFSNSVRVLQGPNVDFITNPPVLTLNNAENVLIQNASNNAVSYNWSLNGKEYSVDKDLTYTFADTGVYVFKLQALSQNGCSNSLTKDIHIGEGFNLFVPNCFTPNGNTVNDVFIPKGTGWSPLNYEFYVYNRWGSKVFETSDITQGWDGGQRADKQDPGFSKYDKDNVYAWRIVVTDTQRKKHYLSGLVTLLK